VPQELESAACFLLLSCYAKLPNLIGALSASMQAWCLFAQLPDNLLQQ